MKTLIHGQASRRAFLARSASLTALAATPFAATLATLGAQAQSAPGYKALVCVFLFGGNDHANTIAPISGTEYTKYASARNQCALPAADFLPIMPTNYSGPALGLHPALGGIKSLFDDNKCAIMANVGPLAYPITKAQWNNGSPTVNVPSQLTSHADQQRGWQTGLPDAASETGWFGRMGDVLAPLYQSSSNVSINISTAGDNTIQVGNGLPPYQITPNGAIRVDGLSNLFGGNVGSALRDVLTQDSGAHLMESQYAATIKRSIDTEALVSQGLTAAGQPTATFFNDPLSNQLKMVARLIKASSAYSHQRQIFFVGLGGFDFHDNLINGQNDRLTMVNNAIKSFYDETVLMGVSNQVTTFTASDFGRALQSNGDGSDHGWGGHQFVVGGAVNGNRIAGTMPMSELGSNDDAGNGILIPTTSVDQYAGSLATWLGVPANELATVMPNINRFNSSASLGLFV